MFDDCSTAKETRVKLIKIVTSVELSIVQESIAEKFYNVEDVVRFLYNAVSAGGNGILHGPGGFGKSEITKAFFNYYGIDPLIIVGHSGTDIEALLGIPNIKKLTDESVYEVAFEKSIFNNAGILILEEFLDVKPTVATALKDIITAGGYRSGNKFIPSKIGSMFICSNKSPEDVSIDFSTAAFYKERFPYSKYVIWDDYSSNAYLNLFKLVYKNKFIAQENAFKLIAELCSESCNTDTIISPRTSFSAMDLFLINQDIDALTMVNSIDIRKVNEIQIRLKLEDQYIYLNNKFLLLINMVSALEFKTIKEIAAFIAFNENFKNNISIYKLEGDELLKTLGILMNIMDVKLTEANASLINLGDRNKIMDINNLYEDIHQFISQ